MDTIVASDAEAMGRGVGDFAWLVVLVECEWLQGA